MGSICQIYAIDDPIFRFAEPDKLRDLLAHALPDKVLLNHMGTSPTAVEEWGYCVHTAIPVRDLYDVVVNGRYWLNALDLSRAPGLELFHQELLTYVRKIVPTVEDITLNLLISSPGAIVHYHVDPEPNMLIQVVGEKRVYVYPVNERLVPQGQIDQICAGMSEEEVPYRLDFDAEAEVVTLTPGKTVVWPQNSPHRVENGDVLNVSFGISLLTPSGMHRMRVQAANYWLRRAGRKHPSGKVDGLGPQAKVFAFRAVRRFLPNKQKQRTYRWQVVPTAAGFELQTLDRH